MKLTPAQLATIETYLLSWKLQFRDFYDEMFDHFCSEIEQRMSNGTSFENAFLETSYLFSGHEYKPRAIFNFPSLKPRYFGPKAFEMEWYDALRKRNNNALWQRFINQVVSLRGIFWVAIYLLLFTVSVTYSLPKIWLVGLIFPLLIHIVSLVVLIVKDKGKFKFGYLFASPSPDANRHDTKSTLHGTSLTSVHQFNTILAVLGLLLNSGNILLDAVQVPLWVGCGITVMFSMLVAAQIEATKRYQKKNKVPTEN